MHRPSHLLSFIGIGILVLISIIQADYRLKRGHITADNRCKNDGDCVKRGYTYCSFASGETRDGVDVGWCQVEAVWKWSHPRKSHTTTTTQFHGGKHHHVNPAYPPKGPTKTAAQFHGGSHHHVHHSYKSYMGSKPTWDYRCMSDAECIKRGHDFCSFASAEQRDGVDVGWCQKGNNYFPQTTSIPETTTVKKTTTTTTTTTTPKTTTTSTTTPSTTAYTTTKPPTTTEFKAPETTAIISDYPDNDIGSFHS